MRTGRRGDVTTAWPSAASVGARMIARTSASGHARSPSSATPTTNPARIVSGRPIPSRRGRYPERPAERRQVDARRVREEDDRERRLGERLDLDAGRRGIDEPERLDADDEAGGREDHRRGDRRALDATGDRREAEEDEARAAGELPVHARSFAEAGSTTRR